jgi:putative oxidoreductase
MINYLKLMTFGPVSIRIVIGIIFIITGWPKLLDIQQTQSFFMMAGLLQELAVIIGLLEMVGGILLVVGLLTRILAFLFVIEMIGAIIVVNILSSVVPVPVGYEIAQYFIPILMLIISVSLILTGPGRISIERDILQLELTPLGRDMVFSIREHNSRTQL